MSVGCASSFASVLREESKGEASVWSPSSRSSRRHPSASGPIHRRLEPPPTRRRPPPHWGELALLLDISIPFPFVYIAAAVLGRDAMVTARAPVVASPSQTRRVAPVLAWQPPWQPGPLVSVGGWFPLR